MIDLPTHTECGECRRQVKLKRANWELWTDDAQPVGMSQQRECHGCKSIVLAAIGSEEFVTMLMKHFGNELPTH